VGKDVDPEEQWLTVHMGSGYTDPVVIVGPASELGGQEAVARIKGLRYQSPCVDPTDCGTGGMNTYSAGSLTDSDKSVNDCDGHCFDLRLQASAQE
jgi:hypothetical protein